MRRITFLITLLLVSILGFAQTIDQIGYYSKNGVMGLSSKDNYMILNPGEIIDNTSPSSPSLVSQYSFDGDGITVFVNDDYAYFGT
jgi:hypothetical protein